ncbi:flagellar motor protein MotA [Alphaproteobacteria bacterium]|nr:flagellar motor protein MotA [Alphaproteobacteria bacterium]
MTHIRQTFTRMIIFVLSLVLASAILFQSLETAFRANPAINGLIIGILFIGIIYVFRQVWILRPEIKWINNYRRDSSRLSSDKPPKLLGPMSTMLGERGNKKMRLATISMRSILDGISFRLDESRELSRYLIGLLIFLGLLGTFWGLLQTIGSVSIAISNIEFNSGELNKEFDLLKNSLEAPLSGMGTAFSSSLFGLAGSLILGFLDLQAGQAQNRFYNNLEEWLSSLTNLSTNNSLSESDQSVPAYVQALLEQTADSLDNLRRTVSSTESNRHDSEQTMIVLTEKLSTLTDQMKSQQDIMIKLVENQLEVKPILDKLYDIQNSNTDKANKTHLRNIENNILKLVEQTSKGQGQMILEFRNEMKLLAKTFAASISNLNNKR